MSEEIYIEYALPHRGNFAEGSFDRKHKPTQDEINELLKKDGYISLNIEIWYDDLMDLWQFIADDLKEQSK
jgi:hypothetical protein